MSNFLTPEEQRSIERKDTILGQASYVVGGVAAVAGAFYASRTSAAAVVGGAIRRATQESAYASGSSSSLRAKTSIIFNTLARLSKPASLGTFEPKYVKGVKGAVADMFSPKVKEPILDKSFPSDRKSENLDFTKQPKGYTLSSTGVGGISNLWEKVSRMVDRRLPGESSGVRASFKFDMYMWEARSSVSRAYEYEKQAFEKNLKLGVRQSSGKEYDFVKNLVRSIHVSYETTGRPSAKSGYKHGVSLSSDSQEQVLDQTLDKTFGQGSIFQKIKGLSAPRGFRRATLDDLRKQGLSSEQEILVGTYDKSVTTSHALHEDIFFKNVEIEGKEYRQAYYKARGVVGREKRAFSGDSVFIDDFLLKKISDKYGGDLPLGLDVFVYTGEDAGALTKLAAGVLGVKKGDILNTDITRPSRILAKTLSAVSQVSIPFTQLLFGKGGIRPGTLLLPEKFEHYADPFSASVVAHADSRISVISGNQSLEQSPLDIGSRVFRKTLESFNIDVDKYLGPEFGSKNILARYDLYGVNTDIKFMISGIDKEKFNLSNEFIPPIRISEPEFTTIKNDELLYLGELSYSSRKHISKRVFDLVEGLEDVESDVFAQAMFRKYFTSRFIPIRSKTEFRNDLVSRHIVIETEGATLELLKSDLVVSPANQRFGESLKQQLGRFDNVLEEYLGKHFSSRHPNASESEIDRYITDSMISLWGRENVDAHEYGVHKFFRSMGFGSEYSESPSVITKAFRWMLGSGGRDRPLTLESLRTRVPHVIPGLAGGVTSADDFQIHPLAYLELTKPLEGIDRVNATGLQGQVGFIITKQGPVPYLDPTRTSDWMFASSDELFKSLPGYFVRRTISVMDEIGLGAVPHSARSRVFPKLSDVAQDPSKILDSMAGFLVFKRILPITTGIYGAGYVDYELDQMFGTSPLSAAKGVLGDFHVLRKTITQPLQPIADYMEDNFEGSIESPGSYLVRFGLPIGLGSLIGGHARGLGIAAGILLTGDLTQTPEETAAIMSGEQFVPIRKGRFWETSHGNYFGGRVLYNRPHFLALKPGEELEDYFTYGAIPTPRALLSGYPGILDPYAFERDRADERPYPVTGPHALEELPIVGSYITATGIGPALKPTRFTEVFKNTFGINQSPEYGIELLGGMSSSEYGMPNFPTFKETEGYPQELSSRIPGFQNRVLEGIDRVITQSGDFLGIYGFAVDSILQGSGGPYSKAHSSVWQSPRGILGPESYFYQLEAGGAFTLSEFIRRIFVNFKIEPGLNPIRNAMPYWTETELANLHLGDPYTNFAHSSLVPGGNYSRYNKELAGMDPSDYPLAHQARILANAAPYDWTTKAFLKRGHQEMMEGNMSPREAEVLMSAIEENDKILEGREFDRSSGLWSSFTSTRNFFIQKLFGNQTGTEAYMRERVYGHEIPAWQSPVSEFIMPSFYKSFGEDSAAGSTFSGGLLGLSLGANPLASAILGAGGAIAGLVGSSYTGTYQRLTGEKWKPEFRREEEEIKEYFDKLTWIKGVILNDKRMIESTATGVNPFVADQREVLAAIGKDEKEYYQEFLQVKSSVERERILEIVPSYVRRVLKGWWARHDFENDLISKSTYDSEREKYQEELDFKLKNPSQVYSSSVFTDGDLELPDRSWSGWDKNVDLQGVKLKVLEQRAMNIHRFGLWQSDINLLKSQEMQAPAPPSRGLPSIWSLYSHFTNSGSSRISSGYNPLMSRDSVEINQTVQEDPYYEIRDRVRYGQSVGY